MEKIEEMEKEESKSTYGWTMTIIACAATIFVADKIGDMFLLIVMGIKYFLTSL
jgi:hypothetical protein